MKEEPLSDPNSNYSGKTKASAGINSENSAFMSLLILNHRRKGRVIDNPLLGKNGEGAGLRGQFFIGQSLFESCLVNYPASLQDDSHKTPKSS